MSRQWYHGFGEGLCGCRWRCHIKQLARLLDAVCKYRPHRYAEVVLIACTGLRPSEVFALEWSDVNWDTGEIAISKRVDKRGNVDAPKTENGEMSGARTTVVDAIVLKALKEHRKWLLREGRTGSHLCFPSRAGTYRTSASLDKVFELACDVANIDIRVKSKVLRRTFNTLVKDRTDRVTLWAMMGHSSEEMTQRYSGVTYEQKAEVAHSFATLIDEARGG